MRTRSALRHALELGVGVLILSLAIRTWIIEGVIVPVIVSGGSMAQGLCGPHRKIDCNRCGYPVICGIERLPGDGRAVCPNCGAGAGNLAASPDRRGDHVLIDRTAWLARPPRRWEPVVFRCPERPGQYCVKRVVGLPGESIEIRHGDVYVDGQMARKHLAAARATAQLVHDTAYRPRQKESAAPRWQGDGESTRWQTRDAAFLYTDQSPAAAQNRPVDWLTYRHLHDQPVRDDYGYNQGESRRMNLVSDLMLSCKLTVSGPGPFVLRATDGRDQFEAWVHPHQSQLRLERNGRPVAHASDVSLPMGRETTVEFFLFDRQVLLAVDGALQLAYPYEPSQRPYAPTSRPLAIGSQGVGLVVRHIQVRRDVYYTDPGPATPRWALAEPYKLAAGEFFLLGDNSPISHDSRSYPRGGVPAKLLIGKPLGSP